MNNVKIYDINDDGTLKFNPDVNHLMYLWFMKTFLYICLSF